MAVWRRCGVGVVSVWRRCGGGVQNNATGILKYFTTHGDGPRAGTGFVSFHITVTSSNGVVVVADYETERRWDLAADPAVAVIHLIDLEARDIGVETFEEALRSVRQLRRLLCHAHHAMCSAWCPHRPCMARPCMTRPCPHRPLQ